MSSTATLSQQVRRGMRWVAIGQILTQLSAVAVNPILYRLLEPANYGMYYRVTVALGFFGAVAGLGLNYAIIQRKELSDDELMTAFWGNLGAGVLVCLFGIISMPFIAWIYNDPMILWIGIAHSLTFIGSSLNNMSLAVLARKMQFNRQVAITSCNAVLGGSASIAFALLGFQTWGLVLSTLVAQSVSVFLGFWLTGFRPRLHFKWEELKRLRKFSLYLSGEIAANYLYNNLDYLVIGYILGKTAHGYYTQAFNLTHLPYHQITPIVIRVMFAAFSKQQSDDAALREGYLRVTQGLAIVTFPILGFLGVAADFIVPLYFGGKWTSIIPYVRILALVGALKCIVTCVGLIINSKGRSDLGFRWNVFLATVMGIAMIFGVRYGVEGVCWAWIAVSVPSSLAIQMITHKLVKLDNREYARRILPVFFASVLFVLLLLVLREALATFGDLSHRTQGIALSLVAVVMYTGGIRKLAPELWKAIFSK